MLVMGDYKMFLHSKQLQRTKITIESMSDSESDFAIEMFHC